MDIQLVLGIKSGGKKKKRLLKRSRVESQRDLEPEKISKASDSYVEFSPFKLEWVAVGPTGPETERGRGCNPPMQSPCG